MKHILDIVPIPNKGTEEDDSSKFLKTNESSTLGKWTVEVDTQETNNSTKIIANTEFVHNLVDEKTNNNFKLKGTIQNKSYLPNKNNLGDIYKILDDNTFYFYDGSNWNILANENYLLNYLPTSGGAMNGAIIRNGILAQLGNTSSSISIQNDSSNSNNGGIFIYGNTAKSNAGTVRIQSVNDKNSYQLDINSDGTATFNGKEPDAIDSSTNIATTKFVQDAIKNNNDFGIWVK